MRQGQQGAEMRAARQALAVAQGARPRAPGLCRAAGPRDGPGPRLWIGQFPLRGDPHALGPGEGSHRLRGHAGPVAGSHVDPSQLHGLEINPYAQQLAQVVIWIGYLQWMHHNGFKMPDDPVLAADRVHPADGRDPGPFRPGASEGARVAGGGIHRGEPAVLGKSGCGRNLVTTTLPQSGRSVTDRRAGHVGPLLLLV